jgi:hypothetical protein
MTKTEQRELATARQYAVTWPQYAARTISVMRRCTRRNATLDATLAVITELKLEPYFVPGTNYMLTR